jgi:hypothetical protein
LKTDYASYVGWKREEYSGQTIHEAYEKNKDSNMLLNMESSLNTKSNIYIDECHLNALGNSIVANKIDSLTRTLKY